MGAVPLGLGLIFKDPNAGRLSTRLKLFFKKPHPVMLGSIPLSMAFGAWCEDYRYRINQDNR